jgi:hypothetical protein
MKKSRQIQALLFYHLKKRPGYPEHRKMNGENYNTTFNDLCVELKFFT